MGPVWRGVMKRNERAVMFYNGAGCPIGNGLGRTYLYLPPRTSRWQKPFVKFTIFCLFLFAVASTYKFNDIIAEKNAKCQDETLYTINF